MVTYDDVAYFYKDKENEAKYSPQGDACQKLAETFFYGCGDSDDYIYSLEIKKRMIDGTLTQLATFKYFKEEDAFKLVLSGFIPKKEENRIVINPSQKWHLYVSYLAYQEVRANLNFSSKVKKIPGDKFNKEVFCFGRKVKQKEYAKWMKKASGLGDGVPWKNVEKLIENWRK